MDRTEELELIKKELFNLRLKKVMNIEDTNAKVLNQKEVDLNKKYITLLKEIDSSNGQVAFGFVDQIDLSLVDEKEMEDER